jgi:hypothetical protein
MLFLRQSTAVTVKVGPFLSTTDGDTEKTALTIAQSNIQLSKAGAAFAQSHNSAGAGYDSNAYYGVPLDTTDTNTVGPLQLNIHVSTALVVWEDYFVLPQAIYDWLTTATNLPVDLQTIKTQAVTCAAGVTVLASLGTAAASTAQTGDNFARLGAPSGASIAADIAAAKSDTAAIKTQTDKLNFTGSYVQSQVKDQDNIDFSALQKISLNSARPTGAAAESAAVTANGANSATSFQTTLVETVDSYWNDALLKITSGALAGQVKRVTGYVGSTKTITVATGFTSTPANGVTFDIINQ